MTGTNVSQDKNPEVSEQFMKQHLGNSNHKRIDPNPIIQDPHTHLSHAVLT